MDKENPDFKEKYMEKYISARDRLKYTEEEKKIILEILGMDLNVDWDLLTKI